MLLTKIFTSNSPDGTDQTGYWYPPCISESATFIVEAVGAGGHGSRSGNGGSGGAYCKSIVTASGADTLVYTIGLATKTDGEATSCSMYYGGSETETPILRAPGGKLDGTVDAQKTEKLENAGFTPGGVGSIDYTGYASYNGSGGGGAGGDAGKSAATSTRDGGALGGAGVFFGNGGNGAYYNAGSGVNEVYKATDGAVPGGGGGGGYDYGTDSSGNGGNGQIRVSYQHVVSVDLASAASASIPPPAFTGSNSGNLYLITPNQTDFEYVLLWGVTTAYFDAPPYEAERHEIRRYNIPTGSNIDIAEVIQNEMASGSIYYGISGIISSGSQLYEVPLAPREIVTDDANTIITTAYSFSPPISGTEFLSEMIPNPDESGSMQLLAYCNAVSFIPINFTGRLSFKTIRETYYFC